MSKIGVVSYGVGNIGSIINMINRMGFSAIPVSTPQEIQAMERLILPGVGSFDGVKLKLDNSKLIPYLAEMVLEKHIPLLGICVGMQILFDGSEEGELPGLGWIQGRVEKFKSTQVKIPHVGWDYVAWKELPFYHQLSDRYYFTHTYKMLL